MSSASTAGDVNPFARAELLLRTVTGIAAARIVAHPSNAGGIAMIRVHCTDEASPGQIIRNVRSALFAGCGIAISAECIDFVGAGELDGVQNAPIALKSTTVSNATSTAAPSDAIAGESHKTPVATDKASGAPPVARPAALYTQASAPSDGTVPDAPPLRTIRIAQPGAANAPAASYDVSREAVARDIAQMPAATGTIVQTDRVQRILQVVADDDAAQFAAPMQSPLASPMQTPLASPMHMPFAPMHATTATPAAAPAPQTIGGSVREVVASAAAIRLESVEMRRQAGRLRCRVVISLGNDHFGAVADSSDVHSGEIPLAGRVACDALRAGGFTDARFDGAAIAQINGRHHVVVALSEWMSGETMILSGAAPLEDVPERAAAIAAIKAVLAQDIN